MDKLFNFALKIKPSSKAKKPKPLLNGKHMKVLLLGSYGMGNSDPEFLQEQLETMGRLREEH